MNSRVFVQPSMGIPAGPLPETNKASGTAPNKLSGAIVRPVSREIEGKGSVRMDPANCPSVPESHVRHYDLDNYVDWLKAKIEADKRDSRVINQPAVVRVKTSPTPAETAPQKPAKRRAIKIKPARVAPVRLPEESVVKPADATTRVSHSAIQSSPTVGATPSDNFFSTVTDTDLVQVLDTNPVSLAPIKGVRFEELSGLGITTDKLHRIHESHVPDEGETNRVPIAEAHVTFPDPSTLEEEPGDGVQISAKDTDSFISMVSKAIASVLTETPEPSLEEKVRAHFESELHARAIQSLLPTVESESLTEQDLNSIRPDSRAEEPAMAVAVEDETSVLDSIESETLSIANEPDFEPTVSIVSEADQIAAEILSSTAKDIPTGVAAWDVEDFRWPVVTNQMIVSGGSAINELAESIFSMITPAFQRLAITGLGRGEGTSSIAITLARWVAALGKKVLLVDADIAHPGLSGQVGLAPNISWINAIRQSQPAAEVIVRSKKSNLCIMPFAPTDARSTWPRFVYDRLGELIDPVRSHFDLVIVDAGPSSQLLAELSRPQHLVDATLMVHDGVNSPEFQRAKSMLEGFGLNRFIVARNRAQQQNSNVA